MAKIPPKMKEKVEEKEMLIKLKFSPEFYDKLINDQATRIDLIAVESVLRQND